MKKNELAPSPRMIVEAAERRQIPWLYDRRLRLLQLGYGKNRRWIRSMTTNLESDVAVRLSQDKELTKRLLDAAMIPVPRGRVVKSAAEAIRAFRQFASEFGPRFTGTFVMKPVDGHKGQGVSAGLSTLEQVLLAYGHAVRYSPRVLLEEQLEGKDFRVLVVGGKLFAAAERIAAHVVGDGIHSIEELIEIENRNPARGAGHSLPLTRIPLDPVCHAFLERIGTSFRSVPAAGQRVLLRDNANLSCGGTARDVTERVHPEVRALCERVSRVLGLGLCGVDLILEDISRPPSLQPRGGVIEVNAGPGIRVHHFPAEGSARDAGAAIVEYLFPKGSFARIPVVAVLARPAGFPIADRLGKVLEFVSSGEFRVGVASAAGIRIGAETVSSRDARNQAGARAVLMDPAVEIAILEAPHCLAGPDDLPYDECDIAVLAHGAVSAAIVAERVREGGSLLINSKDEELLLLGAALEGKRNLNVVYFSGNAEEAVLAACRCLTGSVGLPQAAEAA